MSADEERIALFIDWDNLAIGAREDHGTQDLDFSPIAAALADRGRVVVRRAYADWAQWETARKSLTRHHVELIEIPQRMGASRKNAADIKLVCDALELAFERDYVTTFVLCTGDSDFTPLVHKLRELDKRVIGIGMKASTSKLLPGACDEFLFYERLEGVDVGDGRQRRRGHDRPATANGTGAAASPAEPTETDLDVTTPAVIGAPPELARLISTTLAGLQQGGATVVQASALKRAIVRKDPTFAEAEYGFRGFGELLRNLEARGIVALSEGTAAGDPVVSFPEAGGSGEDTAFALLRDVVADAATRGHLCVLSGLKNQLRKRDETFSEKTFGYGGFLQFCKAAATRNFVDLGWDEEADDWVLRPHGDPVVAR